MEQYFCIQFKFLLSGVILTGAVIHPAFGFRNDRNKAAVRSRCIISQVCCISWQLGAPAEKQVSIYQIKCVLWYLLQLLFSMLMSELHANDLPLQTAQKFHLRALSFFSFLQLLQKSG